MYLSILLLVPFGLGIAVAFLAGAKTVNRDGNSSTQISKSVLCLWLGCAVASTCAAFVLGADHVYKLMLDSGDYNGGDGPLEISIGLPMVGVYAAGFIAAILALIGFILSWTLNRQPFLSRPHLACLLFLLPLAFYLLLVWNDI